MEILSLPMRNGELKVFVEYHSIQKFKFILATSHGNTFTTNE